MPPLHRIKQFLARRPVMMAAFVLAVAARLLLQLWFHSTDNDKAYQLQGALNLLQGHGLSLYQCDPADIARGVYAPITMWPPGYSVLVSPFLVLCGQNTVLASFLFDACCCLLLLASATGLMKEMGMPAWWRTAYVIFSGFFIYPFTIESATDLPALAFFITGLYFMLKLFHAQKTTLAGTLPMVLFLLLAAATRYQYLPLALVPPVFLWLAGKRRQDIQRCRIAAFSFVTLLLLSGLLLLWQWTRTGAALYVPEAESSFHPERWATIYAFLLAAFMNVDFFAQQTASGLQVPYTSVETGLGLLHQLLLLILAIAAIRWWWKTRRQAWGPIGFYLRTGIVASAGVLLTLLYLAVFAEPETYGVKGWTHLLTPRYYAFPVFFAQQLLFLAFYRRRQLPAWIRKALVLPLLLLLADLGHNLYFTGKNLVTNRSELQRKATRSLPADHTLHLLDSIRSQHPDRPLALVSQPAYLSAQAGAQHFPAVYWFKPLAQLRVSSPVPAGLVIITQHAENIPVSLSSLPGFREIGRFRQYRYFLAEPTP